ncbi:DUF2807 domain-containing protein [Sphingomicrobium flavum]|uniref:DUF2807 domain-containing protein n=1 Tax=Sphingomicrobium flavum TaxID=1229164 RepID=UPI0021ADBBAE|nr:DUF2807 domain-containing protein [Sphingomicrobium flavum]
MRIIALFLALFALVSPAAAQQRNHTVSSFEEVRVRGAVDVTIETDVAPYARVIGPAAAAEQISIEQNGRILIISINRSAWGRNPSDRLGEPLRVELGTPKLEKATLNGSGRITIPAIENDEFTLMLGGSGYADVKQMTIERLTIGLAGAGGMRLAGEAMEASMLVRGLTSLQAADLAVRDLKLAVDGNGLVNVTATNTLDLEARGAGDITLEGSPACTLDIEGPTRVTGCEVREGFGRSR